MLLDQSAPGRGSMGLSVLLMLPLVSLSPSWLIRNVERGYLVVRGSATYRDRKPGEFWFFQSLIAFTACLLALVLLLLGFASTEDLPTSIAFDLVFLGAIGFALRKPKMKRERWGRAPSIAFIVLSLPPVIANVARAFSPPKPDAWALLLIWLGGTALALHAMVALRGRPIRTFHKALSERRSRRSSP